MACRARLIVPFLILLAAIPAEAADLDSGLEVYERGDYELAFNELLPLAKEGNAEAAFRLGLMYLNGHGVPKDERMAREWLERAGNNGTAAMQREVGKVYDKNESLGPAFMYAEKWFGEAARGGDAEAISLYAMFYEYGRDYKKYRFGRFTEVYPEKAVEFYLMTAEKDYAPAQSALAAMYHFARGIPQDDNKALEWAQKAADQGDARAYSILGSIYHMGDGVDQDMVEAHKWFLLAELSGHPVGMPLRRRLEVDSSPQQVAEARRRAISMDLGVESLIASTPTIGEFCRTDHPDMADKEEAVKEMTASEIRIPIIPNRHVYYLTRKELRKRMDFAYETGHSDQVEELIDILTENACFMLKL